MTRHRFVMSEIHKIDERDLSHGSAVINAASLLVRSPAECLDCRISWYDRATQPECPGVPEGTEPIAPEWRP